MVERPVPLDADRIRKSVGHDFAGKLLNLNVLPETGSTNDELMGFSGEDLHGSVLLAELQTAGKGRRGRSWSTSHGNISMSIGWHYPDTISAPARLSLLAGIAVCRALAQAGLKGHGVKWPNDIVVDGAKLGGILVELRHRRTGIDVVLGIGINISLAPASASDIDQPWSDLSRHCGFSTLDRNEIVAIILREVFCFLEKDEEELGMYFARHWGEWDTLDGKNVRLVGSDKALEGRVEGVSMDGGLQVSVTTPGDDQGQNVSMKFFSGEVSVRHA